MKTALVLEGGGMRGAYTAGCLAWLLDEGIGFDYAYGISTGAVYLGAYLMHSKKLLYDCATDYIADEKLIGKEAIKREHTYVGYNYLFDELLPQAGYDLKRLAAERCQGKIGLYDLALGKAVYRSFRELDPDLQLLKASSTLPIIGHAVKYAGHLYLDAGISEMIPIRQAEEDGNTKHLVITTKPQSFVRKPSNKFIVGLMALVYAHYPSVHRDYAIRHLHYNEQVARVKSLAQEGKAVHIFPSESAEVNRFAGDKAELRKLYALGLADMERQREILIREFKQA